MIGCQRVSANKYIYISHPSVSKHVLCKNMCRSFPRKNHGYFRFSCGPCWQGNFQKMPSLKCAAAQARWWSSTAGGPSVPWNAQWFGLVYPAVIKHGNGKSTVAGGSNGKVIYQSMQSMAITVSCFIIRGYLTKNYHGTPKPMAAIVWSITHSQSCRPAKNPWTWSDFVNGHTVF